MSRFRPALFIAPVLAVSLSLAPRISFAANEQRTWTDSSGEFKIEAKFVSEANGKVTLEQDDGSEIEIPLDKLSAADQKVVAKLKKPKTINPFQPAKKNPFAPRKPGSPPSSPKTPSDPTSGEPRNVKVDWSGVETISLAFNGEPWKVEVAPTDLAIAAKPRPIAIPAKTNFFEGVKGLAVNAIAKKAVVGYLLGEPKPQGTTRLVLCDLEAGRAAPVAVTTGQFIPLALHDDGRQVIMCREEFGFGKHDRLELWTIDGATIEKTASWVPYDHLQGGGRDITWAAFLDAEHLATYAASGDLAVWKFPELTVEYHVPIAGGGTLALSPDRKTIAYCDGRNVGLFDVASRSVMAQSATPVSLHAPKMAFSPTGKRIACIAQDKLLVWDVATGNLIQNMGSSGLHIFTGIEFPHDSYVLGGNRYLIDIENQLKVWTYDGHEQVRVIGDWTLFAVLDGQQSAALLPVKLPHPAAASLQKKAASDPSTFILRPGVKVRVDVTGIKDAAAREAAAKALGERLKSIGCQADPSGTMTITALVEGPKEKTLSLRNSGDYQVQEYVTRVRLMHENTTVWETSSTNVPGGPVIFFNLEEGENIGTWLKKREKPDYGLFERVELPKYLQKPTAGAGPRSSLTLGTSRVTTSGIP